MTEYADLRCGDDLDPTGGEALPIEVLAQDLYHLLITPPRSLIRDPNWGLGLVLYLSRPLPSTIEDDIANSLRNDDRVSDARAKVTNLGSDEAGYRIDIQAETDAGFLAIALSMTPSGIVRIT